MLAGGAGADVFIFDEGDGNDVINDFQVGVDRIDLDDFDFRSFSSVMNRGSQEGDDAVFDLGSSVTITLFDVELASLGAGDFIL